MPWYVWLMTARRDQILIDYRGTTDQELDVASLLRPTKSMSAWLHSPGEDSSGLTCFTRDWVKHLVLSFFCLNFSPSLMWDFLHPGWLHWGLWKQLWILSKVPGRFYSIMILSANIPYVSNSQHIRSKWYCFVVWYYWSDIVDIVIWHCFVIWLKCAGLSKLHVRYWTHVCMPSSQTAGAYKYFWSFYKNKNKN